MADDADVPPLEDMSDLLKQVDAMKEIQKKQQQSKSNGQTAQKESKVETKKMSADSKTPSETRTKEVVEKKQPPDKQKVQPKGSNFGGLKKGFLSSGPAKPKSASSSNKTVSSKTTESKTQSKSGTASAAGKDDIPFIRRTENSGSESLQMSEVQEAMAKTNEKLVQNKEWVTDDLLGKIQKNEKLVQRLQDPTFVRAIGEFQEDPQTALTKYANNEEVQEFFKDFCGIMGEHFSKLGDEIPGEEAASSSAGNQSQSTITTATPGGADISVRSSTNPMQPTAEDETKMQNILSNPEVRVVLMDPKIQELFEVLRNDPAKGERLMQTADVELKKKIKKLVDVGLLQFQR